MTKQPIKALDRGRSVIYAAKIGLGYEEPTADFLLDLAMNTALAGEAGDIDCEAVSTILDGFRAGWIALVEEADEVSNMQPITTQEAEQYYHRWYCLGFVTGAQGMGNFDELGGWPEWMNFYSAWPKVFLREIAALIGYRDGAMSRKMAQMASRESA